MASQTFLIPFALTISTTAIATSQSTTSNVAKLRLLKRSKNSRYSSSRRCGLWVRSVSLPSTDQTLPVVQPYRFAPAGASVLKKVSPIEQVAGNAVPAFDGLVDVA